MSTTPATRAVTCTRSNASSVPRRLHQIIALFLDDRQHVDGEREARARAARAATAARGGLGFARRRSRFLAAGRHEQRAEEDRAEPHGAPSVAWSSGPKPERTAQIQIRLLHRELGGFARDLGAELLIVRVAHLERRGESLLVQNGCLLAVLRCGRRCGHGEFEVFARGVQRRQRELDVVLNGASQELLVEPSAL